MNNPACSPERVEADKIGEGPAVVLCVFHLIAGVLAAFVALVLLAAFAT